MPVMTRIASTRPIKKVLGGAICLSHRSPWIAETGRPERNKDSEVLRITDYETAQVVAELPVPMRAHTMRFSPDGRRLLVLPGGRGSWRQLVIYEAPWKEPPVVHDDSLSRVFDATWLDDDELVIAGSEPYLRPCIARWELRTQTVTILEGQLDVSTIDDGVCTSSGLIAFSCDYGQTIVTCQLSESRQYAPAWKHFAGQPDGNGVHLIGNLEGTQLVLVGRQRCTAFSRDGVLIQHWSGGPSGLFDREVFRNDLFYRRSFDRYRNNLSIVHLGPDTVPTEWHAEIDAGGQGLDVVRRGDRSYLANETADHTDIYELTDPDVLVLQEASGTERVRAAQRLRYRRYRPAVPQLVACLHPSDLALAEIAASTLSAIGDPAAIPALLRALGARELAPVHPAVVAALQLFPAGQLVPAVDASLEHRSAAQRRGAARLLARSPSIEAVARLARAVSDVDPETRREAALGLAARKLVAGGVALLVALSDEDGEVRDTALRGLTDLVGAAVTDGAAAVDLRRTARLIVAGSSADGLARSEDPSVRFLRAVLSTLIEAVDTAAVLNGLETLATALGDAGGAAIMLIAAELPRERGRWQHAALLYRRAAELCRAAGVRHLQWRAQLCGAECLTRAGDHRGAWRSLQDAMALVEALWFELLDEDALQGFFADKWRLFDAAALCCRELGYHATALECSERGRARYLGDLIARRHLAGGPALQRSRAAFWGELPEPRWLRARAIQGAPGPHDRDEVVAVDSEGDAPTARTAAPQRWADLAGVAAGTPELHTAVALVQALWTLAAEPARRDDDQVRGALEGLYGPITALIEAIESGVWPPDGATASRLDEQYTAAFRVFFEQTRLVEAGFGLAARALASADADAWHAALLSIREALDVVLHHAPVRTVPWHASEDAAGTPPRVITRSAADASPDANPSITVVEARLARFEQTRWRHVLALARGRSAGFREIAADLGEVTDQAHVELCVTERGTLVWIAHRLGEPVSRSAVDRDATGEDRLRTWFFPEFTLQELERRLVQANDGWVKRYRARGGEGIAGWLDAMEATLAWLGTALWQPLDAYLREHRIARLRIVPHRALHLVPFAALPSGDAAAPLIESFEIRLAPSMSLLELCRQRERAATAYDFTAVANPTGDLRFAAAEVAAIGASYDEPRRRVLVGPEADLAHLTTSPPGTWYHHAGHAAYDWASPLDSALRLAGETRLTLGDLFDDDIVASGTRIAVLSACETALTDPQSRADDCLGLASGFLFAGAETVIASLWAVDDLSTMLLLRRFHAAHRTQPAPAALQAAQHWLRRLTDADVARLVAECDEAVRALYRDVVAAGDQAFRAPRRGPNGEPFWHPCYWAGFAAWTR